jgi:hypothetical protein
MIVETSLHRQGTDESLCGSAVQGWRQRIADLLLIAGCLAACVGITTSLVLLHIGCAAMALGALIGMRPIHRLPGFAWGP